MVGRAHRAVRGSGDGLPNPPAAYALLPLAVPKKQSYRMVADFLAVNRTSEPAAMPMPDLEEVGGNSWERMHSAH